MYLFVKKCWERCSHIGWRVSGGYENELREPNQKGKRTRQKSVARISCNSKCKKWLFLRCMNNLELKYRILVQLLSISTLLDPSVFEIKFSFAVCWKKKSFEVVKIGTISLEELIQIKVAQESHVLLTYILVLY